MIKFSGVAAGEACTIVLRGATQQLLDEAERSLHDALSVLSQTVKEPATVLGGGIYTVYFINHFIFNNHYLLGCSEMLMSKAVDAIATTTSGKRAMAVEAFGKALRQVQKN